jgi:hypothetical protein
MHMKNVVVSAAASLFVALASHAGPVSLFTSASGGDLAAEAEFFLSGGNLHLKLTNTATVATATRANVLNAVFVQGSLGSFTPVSATVTAGSSARSYSNNTWTNFNWGSNPVGNVGGEWAHATNFAANGQTWNYGVSSTGLGIFGSGTFNGNNLAGPAAVGGQQFGIVSSATFASPPSTSLSAGANAFPLVANSVTFNLGAAAAIGNITKVGFIYGTSLGENQLYYTPPMAPPPVLTVVPLPPAAAAGLTLMVAIPAAQLVRRRLASA